MPIATLHAGARGFDALGDPAPPERLAADGWQVRTFYIAPTSAYATKITDRTRQRARVERIDPHLAAGIGVLLNFEQQADRWTKGAPGGRSDGAWTADLLAELDYPSGLPVLVSWDTDVSAATLPVALAYGEAFDEALNGAWTIGAYAERSVIAGLGTRCRLGWLPLASSWSITPSAPDAVVHWRQRRPTADETARMPYATRSALDVNEALLPFPVWSAAACEPVVIDPSPVSPPPVASEPIVIKPSTVTLPPVLGGIPGKDHTMIVLTFGTPNVDPWYNELGLIPTRAGFTLEHIASVLSPILSSAGASRVAVSEDAVESLLTARDGRTRQGTPGAGVRTVGPSPYHAGGSAPNAVLDGLWLAAAA